MRQDLGRRSRCDHVVIMDTDTQTYGSMITQLKKRGYSVDHIIDPEAVFTALRGNLIDALIVCVDVYALSDDKNAVIPYVKRMNKRIPIIVTSSDDSIETASYVREYGVFYYSLKPIDTEEIVCVIENALHWRKRYDQDAVPGA